MNLHDRRPRVRRHLDDRLRAAADALKEGSATQVDAAGALREIVHAGRPAAADPATALPGEPPPAPPADPPLRTRHLALAVNLVLVLTLGVVVGVVGARRGQGVGASEPPPPASTAVVATTVPPAATRIDVQVPEACTDAAELADAVIERLTRNVRDNQLNLDLRDYTIASQACRRQASPTTVPAGP